MIKFPDIEKKTMGFKDEIKRLGNEVEKLKNQIQTAEATSMLFQIENT